MTARRTVLVLLLILVAVAAAGLTGADDRRAGTADQPKRQRDVIYGRVYGTALTMDVFYPSGPRNGAGVLVMVSGGWFSSAESINPAFARPFTERGYVVFEVVHGSQPKYTIPEILDHVQRAVRYVRANASRFGIDPEKLGVTGGSAGGHLSLMLGLAPEPGDTSAKDPVEREPARVQAVACFFPPTDFLNWGQPGQNALDLPHLKFVYAAFDFRRFDQQTGRFERLPEAERIEIERRMSPVYHVSPDDPPVLIIHGDADQLVPLQQAELIIDRLKEAGVKCKLVVKKGAGHGWPQLTDDLNLFADWFDEHLLGKKPARAAE